MNPVFNLAGFFIIIFLNSSLNSSLFHIFKYLFFRMLTCKYFICWQLLLLLLSNVHCLTTWAEAPGRWLVGEPWYVKWCMLIYQTTVAFEAPIPVLQARPSPRELTCLMPMIIIRKALCQWVSFPVYGSAWPLGLPCLSVCAESNRWLMQVISGG